MTLGSSRFRSGIWGTGVFAFALAAMLLFSSCDESVDPIIESNRQYSLYGVLDMSRDTQFVRVVPIREDIVNDQKKSLDVHFFSADLKTGKRVVWRDSLITFSKDDFGHVFYAPFRVRPGHTYRIELQGPGDKKSTQVVTRVPDRPTPTVFPENLTNDMPEAPIRIGFQRVQWKGLDHQPFRVDLWYRFLRGERVPFRDVRLPYQPRGTSAKGASNIWEYRMNLYRQRSTLDTLISINAFPLFGLGMRVTLLSADFEPPGGVFDREVLAQPGTFSNVKNGFGFVGGVGRFSTEWVLTPKSVQLLGYESPAEAVKKRVPALRRRLHRKASARRERPWAHTLPLKEP